MLRIAHIIQPIAAPPGSEWAMAQPVTFASMRRAQAFVKDAVDVQLFAALSVREEIAVPEGFTATRPLDRTVMDVRSFSVPRPLPLLRDILDRLWESSRAEYFVYTNIDIALMPHFYAAVTRLITQGHDAVVINRRAIPAHPDTADDLPLLYASIGKTHPGYDCFVFARSLYPQFILGDVCIGSGHVDLPLICSMIAAAASFRLITDWHMTFHLGDLRSWRRREMREYRRHNDREAALALLALAKRAPRPMRWWCRLLLRIRLLKNSFCVSEFLRVFRISGKSRSVA